MRKIPRCLQNQLLVGSSNIMARVYDDVLEAARHDLGTAAAIAERARILAIGR